MSCTFAINHVFKTFILFELALDKCQYQFLVSLWQYKIVEWFFVPLNVADAVNIEAAPTAITI